MITYTIDSHFKVGGYAFVLDDTTITKNKINEVIIVVTSFGTNIRIKDAIAELKIRLEKK